MRNPNRIPRILEKLARNWSKYPDLRLGQLLDSLRFVACDRDIDMFYIEDDLIEKELDRRLAQSDDK
jgi:hypothetical protein